VSALARAVRRSSEASAARGVGDVERCDMCAVAVGERHRHVLDDDRGELLCVCQACTLLFDRDAAGGGHYRLVPETRRRLPAVSAKELGVPVGLAFFVRGADGTVAAHYPSPAGPTRWEVAPEVWRAAVRRCPDLDRLAPGTQALLVNTARGRAEHWLAPIDDCYRLVAVIRQEWRGLSGGGRVWPAVDRFFEELTPVR
jgi:Family of unknown function (DUF5947)